MFVARRVSLYLRYVLIIIIFISAYFAFSQVLLYVELFPRILLELLLFSLKSLLGKERLTFLFMNHELLSFALFPYPWGYHE